MDANEISGYITEGMKWLAIGGGSYLAALAGLDVIPKLFSERVKSQEDLDRITEEEAKKLGLIKPVRPKFHNSWVELTIKLDDGNYEINIGGFDARRTTIRHELYHVHKGHLDSAEKQRGFLQALNYLFVHEPQAVAYGSFRIKL